VEKMNSKTWTGEKVGEKKKKKKGGVEPGGEERRMRQKSDRVLREY